jgi:hypothetical protein
VVRVVHWPDDSSLAWQSIMSKKDESLVVSRRKAVVAHYANQRVTAIVCNHWQQAAGNESVDRSIRDSISDDFFP